MHLALISSYADAAREREKISLLTTRIHSSGSSSLATHVEQHQHGGDDDDKVVGIGGDANGNGDGEDDDGVGIDGEGDMMAKRMTGLSLITTVMTMTIPGLALMVMVRPRQANEAA